MIQFITKSSSATRIKNIIECFHFNSLSLLQNAHFSPTQNKSAQFWPDLEDFFSPDYFLTCGNPELL